MQKEITRLLLAVFGAFSLSLLSVRPRPASAVLVSADEADLNDTVLSTDIEYKLQVADRSRWDINDSLSWSVVNIFSGQSNYFLNNTVKEHTFTDTGTYVVRAFRDMKEIANDTLLVGLGESFKVEWPARSEFILGGTLSAEDLSTRVASRTWKVTHGDTVLDLPSANAAILECVPLDTGSYTVEITVNLESGKVERDRQTFRVGPPPAEEPVAEVRTPVKVEPKPKKEPWKPKETTPVVTGNTGECFVTGKKMEGSSFLIKVEKPPRNQVTFEDQATVFKISPKYDCMFTGFEYFSNGKIDDLEIKIECLNRLCVGTAVYPFKRKGGYDAHDAVRIDFTNLPILNKDFEYRITVKAKSPGMLGFFPIQSNVFKPEKQGNTFRMGEASISFADLKTCIFNLRFVR